MFLHVIQQGVGIARDIAELLSFLNFTRRVCCFYYMKQEQLSTTIQFNLIKT